MTMLDIIKNDSLPQWTEHDAVRAARAQSREADDALGAAICGLDRAHALVVAATADLENAPTDKAAARAEAARDAAIRQQADAYAAVERARRSVTRAERATANAESTAKQETAAALREQYDVAVKEFADAGAALDEAAARLTAIQSAVASQFGDPRGLRTRRCLARRVVQRSAGARARSYRSQGRKGDRAVAGARDRVRLSDLRAALLSPSSSKKRPDR